MFINKVQSCVLIFFASSVFLIFFSCSRLAVPPTQKFPPDLDINNYNDSRAYISASRSDFINFLNAFGNHLTFANGYSKDDYIKKFNQKNLSTEFSQWLSNSVLVFNQNSFMFERGNLFDFYFINRNKKKTFFYIHSDVSLIAHSFRLANFLVKNLPEYNMVFVNSSRFHRSQIPYSAEELNSFFEIDVKSFLTKSGFQATQNIFNVACHSTLFTYQFLKNNSSLYEKIIFYAPMVRKSKNDLVQNMELIFSNSSRNEDNYRTLYFLYALSTPERIFELPTPKIFYYFNMTTEKNLINFYFSGLDISSFKNKYLIHAENEALLNMDSYSFSSFQKDAIISLPNMDHSDYYLVRDRFQTYLNALLAILAKK